MAYRSNLTKKKKAYIIVNVFPFLCSYKEWKVSWTLNVGNYCIACRQSKSSMPSLQSGKVA